LCEQPYTVFEGVLDGLMIERVFLLVGRVRLPASLALGGNRMPAVKP
jgi:hypothetical protein